MVVIGIVYPGDGRVPGTRSGVPYSLARGLAVAGVQVEHIRAEPRAPLGRACLDVLTIAQMPRALRLRAPRRSRSLAYNGPALGAVQTWAVRRRLRDTDELDGLVQVGSSYALPPTGRAVTHDDMIVVQAARAGYPVASLSRRQLEARIERQRIAFERAKACCVVTRWAADSIVHDYGIPRERVHVVGGGRNHEPRAVDRDWSTPRFLFVGKDWQRKNGDAVVRAFTAIRRDVPEATLDVIGHHPAIDLPGVRPHGPLSLHRRRERERLDTLFEQATCFVMPSRHEPSGIVFSEANAAGIPSIGSTEGGSGELIGDAGRVVHPDDDAALLAAMRELAEPATARRLGANARRRAKRYTWPAVAERVLRALEPPGLNLDGLQRFL